MSIFPFIGNIAADQTILELPLLKEYAYDFENNELLLNETGKTYLVEGNEALRIWILKALSTERHHYIAYTSAFGEEFREQLIGRTMNLDIIKLELERYIIEALMVNPYIKRLENFIFEKTVTGIHVTFDCASVYGLDTVQVPVREVKI